MTAAEKEGRIEFVTYNIEHAPGERTKDVFQINVSGRRPSMFLHLGESFRVGDSEFILIRFEQKKRPHLTLGQEDVSELTVVNVKTKEPVALIVKKTREVVAGPEPEK
ncbi:MAG: hypothetical protein EOP84_20650 [Verrucomicrobiaceae bacterium]|nr:MAG: hypothetical protein EOP84_20650 [Verrucomicrobiaceae bacterium]